jgi:hypothetical protein
MKRRSGDEPRRAVQTAGERESRPNGAVGCWMAAPIVVGSLAMGGIWLDRVRAEVSPPHLRVKPPQELALLGHAQGLSLSRPDNSQRQY